MERERIRALYLGPSSRSAERVEDALRRADDIALSWHAEAAADQALLRLGEEPFDVMLLGPELGAEAPALLPRLALGRARMPVIALMRPGAEGPVLAARAAGAADLLVLSEESPPDVVRAVRLAIARATGAELRDRHEAVTRGARDALFSWDVQSDRVRFTERWAEMLALPPDEVDTTAETWFARVHPNDLTSLKAAIGTHLAGRTETCEIEYRVRHGDGTYRWVALRGVARRDAGGATLLAGSHTDVHGFKTGAGGMLAELFRDPLTGLPSRALFSERVGRAVMRLKVDPRDCFAVIVLDLDRFQKINEGLGHSAGDRLLAEITQRLHPFVRPGDTLSRLGSDKFGILLDTLRRPSDAPRAAERIVQALAKPIELNGEEVFPSASAGIAQGTPRHDKAEDVISDAYSAMHRAKQRGGGCYEIFDPEEQVRTVARLRLEADLRRAIQRGELCLHYQPVVEMASGRIAGFEALVRWLHPERGLVPPSRFIPIAEETGLISTIGAWVLDEACRTSKRWNDLYAAQAPIEVSVNLSGRQFADPDLAGEVEATLQRHALDPRGIKLEITESVLMEHSLRNADQLKRLRGLGLELSIDDFGTGYSSLSSLHRFPIGTLKIDRTFVNRMEFEEENSEIVRTILTLARNLGMHVVAEGVETQAQLEILRELGCDMGQGFLFSNAVDAESAEAWLESLPA